MAGEIGPAPSRPVGALGLSSTDREDLLQLQGRALRYFVDNQAASGLVLDRQANRGPRRRTGQCSTSATGMGLIALALAAAAPHRLLSPGEAARRIRSALETAWGHLPHDRGMMPHFVHAQTGAVLGADTISTIDSAWLLAGALWAAAFLRDPTLEALAEHLFDRVDWANWATPDDLEGPGELLRHGKGRDGRRLRCRWDRLNGETVFMYVLAVGAAGGRALPASSWGALRTFAGVVAGRRHNHADLGLFVFQYGLDLLDLRGWQAPGGVDLMADAEVATAANDEACRAASADFATYRRYWGLSAGDGPGEPPARQAYRAYAPAGPIDGTAHLMATLAAVAHRPGRVLDNLRAARLDGDLAPLGRYGFSNVNVDRHWVGRDMVAIDAGAAVLALDNVLMDDRVRTTFHTLPCVQWGLDRLGFSPRPAARRAS